VYRFEFYGVVLISKLMCLVLFFVQLLNSNSHQIMPHKHTHTHCDSGWKRGAAQRGKERASGLVGFTKIQDPRPKTQCQRGQQTLFEIFMLDFCASMTFELPCLWLPVFTHTCLYLYLCFMSVLKDTRRSVCIFLHARAHMLHQWISDIYVWFLTPPGKTTQTLKTH